MSYVIAAPELIEAAATDVQLLVQHSTQRT
jgi:hypothetical protein